MSEDHRNILPPISGKRRKQVLGTPEDRPNRFETVRRTAFEPDELGDFQPPEALARNEISLWEDNSKSIVTSNDSPDVGFQFSANPYRGCEHGCVYCYARPTHEYLGLSSGVDFETKIGFKSRAVELLEDALSNPNWKAEPLVLSGVTDPYQPIEAKLKITRSCLELLVQCRQPTIFITKSALILRDLDLLRELARYQAVTVLVSVTSLDPELAARLEPVAASPAKRLETLAKLSEAGIPTGVSVAPVIPGLNDFEMPAILQKAKDSGVDFATYVLLRLPYGVHDLFEAWLERHYPEKKNAVLAGLRAYRGGKTTDPRFGTRMRGEGKVAQVFRKWFQVACRRLSLERAPALSSASFVPPVRRGGNYNLF